MFTLEEQSIEQSGNMPVEMVKLEENELCNK